MCKGNKLFEIEDYEISDNEIEVSTDREDYTIDLTKFENWLRFDDRLNWEYNYSDHTGSHVQELGVMTLDEYWDQNHTYIYPDLYDFIVLKVIGEEVFNVKPALDSILNPAQ